MLPKYRLTQAFAKAEGFGSPGKLPTLRNNPLDLRHSPHGSHVGIGPEDICIIDTVEHGWADGDRQLELWAERHLSIGEAIDKQLGITRDAAGNILVNRDANNVDAYRRIVLSFLPFAVGMDFPVSELLKIPAFEYGGSKIVS